MAMEIKMREKTSKRVGFVACYKGKPITAAQSFEKLVNRKKVKQLLGNKDLLIKHTNPDGMIVVYKNTLSI